MAWNLQSAPCNLAKLFAQRGPAGRGQHKADFGARLKRCDFGVRFVAKASQRDEVSSEPNRDFYRRFVTDKSPIDPQ